MLACGQRIGRYEIVDLLGHGGMASVYRVRHVELGSEHALKLLEVHKQRIRDRLLQEGRAQASLVHPNVVRVTDVLVHEGAPVLVMELVDGPSMDRWFPRQNRVDLGLALRLMVGITRGLRAAHSNGLVHRDLKPANILLANTPEGLLPKLVDFGLVKVVADDRRGKGVMTRSGIAMGTPEFMAPEQIKDAARVDHRADLYSLGCLLYLLVCGRLPFAGHNLVDLYKRIVDGVYRPPRELVPGVPTSLEALIDGLLQGDPDARPQSCDAVLQAIERPTARMVVGQGTLRPPDLLQAASEAGALWETHYGVHPLDRAPPRRAPTSSLAHAWPLFVPALFATLSLASIQGAVQSPREARPASLEDVGVGSRPVEVPQSAPLPPLPEPEDIEEQPRAAPPPPPVLEPVAPAPPVRVSPAQVDVAGDASRVWLVRAGRRYPVPGPVPAGTYEVVVLFPGTEPVSTGEITVGTDPLTLRCSSFAQRCRH